MARVTFVAEGMDTLAEVGHFLDVAFAAGFPMGSEVGCPISGLGGGRLSVSADLRMLPLVDADDEGGAS